MSVLQPDVPGDAGEGTASRIKTEETQDGIRLRIPGPRSRWALPGLLLMVPVAAYVALGDLVLVDFAARTVRTESPAAAAAIVGVLAVLAAVTNLPVLAAGVLLLYHVAGHEVVTATPWMLTHTRRVAFAFHGHHWASARVKNLRLSPMAGGPADPKRMARRGILLDVDGKRTRSMAEGCTPAEAAAVLDAVREVLTRPVIQR